MRNLLLSSSSMAAMTSHENDQSDCARSCIPFAEPKFVFACGFRFVRRFYFKDNRSTCLLTQNKRFVTLTRVTMEGNAWRPEMASFVGVPPDIEETSVQVSNHVIGVCLHSQSASEKHNQEKSPHTFAHFVNF